MSSLEFAYTIAIGSIITSSLLSKSVSLFEGVFEFPTVYLLPAITRFLEILQFFRNVVDNEPFFLMKKQEILWNNMMSSNVSEGDLHPKLREVNVI